MTRWTPLGISALLLVASFGGGAAVRSDDATADGPVPLERGGVVPAAVGDAQPLGESDPTTTTSTTTAPTTTAPPATVAPTTTAPPPPPTTAPPAPPTTAPPATAPAPPPPPAETAQQRSERALIEGVPAMWRADLHHWIEIIDGHTSWARGDGLIMIGRGHATGKYAHLVDVVAHEFGHLIAFEYGTREYPGAGPAGWPAPPNRPEEAWADCVQTVFTGRTNPSHGLAPCGGEQLSWARNWLQQLPG